MSLFWLCNVRPVRLVVLTQPVIDVRHVADIDDLLQVETHVGRNVHVNLQRPYTACEQFHRGIYMLSWLISVVE